MDSKREHGLPYAETVNYWQTSQTSVEQWMERVRALIVCAGGSIEREGMATNREGQTVIVMDLWLDGQRYAIIWPVLPSKTGKLRAAKIQAATLLYHDVKARILTAKVIGFVMAFHNYMAMPDGQPRWQVADWLQPLRLPPQGCGPEGNNGTREVIQL